MDVVPVLDLLNGQVVHAIAGQRADYRPIKSRLVPSAMPLDVAEALHGHFGFATFYVADLDAIAGAQPAFPIYKALQTCGYRICVDAGLRDASGVKALADSGITRIIAGLETLAGPRDLAQICHAIGDQTVFSLDLRSGRPVQRSAGWKTQAWDVLEQAINAGVRAVLLLDLACVGMRSGTGTEELCSRLHRTYPNVEIIAGGGIRNADDLRRLEMLGVGTALMATALHDGSLSPFDLDPFTR
jgi:phosphoribosylformimino-5-aminoimidazole carboxamide ribotide isomerase